MTRSKQGWAGLLSVLLCLCGEPAASVADEKAAQVWRFAVKVDDKPIGQHEFRLSQQGEGWQLLSQAKFDVKILFFEAYRYRHESRERWRNDCLEQIDSSTDDNDKKQWVRGSSDAGRFALRSNRDQKALDGCVMTFAYWNPRILQAQKLLNPQTGDYVSVSIRDLGAQRIAVKGVDSPARRYQLTGRTQDGERLQIDLWYSPDNRWLALQSLTPKGQTLSYQLL